ncbi:glycosyltransferase family 2 protein [Paracoccus albus]|uniref:glycosyltransferase family 2 protein n=1 Tax=Paracoccus albus TaxID=3017784 RepID=UPI0022F08288|nr:glycosyltransferase family 2 protein [Paracoccus albus]WBU62375.1 glycosyltransferase family 2 protein [Paracoccus albus]
MRHDNIALPEGRNMTDRSDDQVRIVMTLLVRNEADIIEDNIRFHHQMGVDNFIVMDNLSTDATPDILRKLSEEFQIRIIQQSDDDYNQAVWVTDMARQASQIYKNSWVINNDADEFWLPACGSLKQFLSSLPEHVTRINAVRYNAVLESDDGPVLSASAHPRTSTVFERVSTNSLGTPLPKKCMHRASPDIEIAQGNHSVTGIGGETFDANEDLMILHYPYRTLDIYRSKIALGGAAYDRNKALSEEVGATWREQYKTIDSGGLEAFWADQVRSPTDIVIERSNAELFTCITVKNLLVGEQRPSVRTVHPLDDLLQKTEALFKTYAAEISHVISRVPRHIRPTRPLYHNIRFCLSGPQQQIKYLKRLRERDITPQELLNDFSSLRDTFSLFPRNDAFRDFLAALLRSEFHDACATLERDCRDRIVVLHVTCAPRMGKAMKSVQSFGQDDRFFHVVAVGQSGLQTEQHTPLHLSYEDGVLTIPVPDSYEALHRKVFYAFTLIDLITSPRMILKLDDNLLLNNRDDLLRVLDRIETEDIAYAGRQVGDRFHEKQWHGWHIGKCANGDIERRGYQFPLPTKYAAGGYGYVLNRRGMSACTYMYLAMKSFFDMNSIGLEDAFVGHAADAAGLSLHDVSSDEVILAFPGLVSI